MHTHQNLETLRSSLKLLRETGKLALVPTMGALHEGHISLVRKARELASHVVVSIFVNPLQFGEGEDFDKYRRTLLADLDLLNKEGVNIVWAPAINEMYPSDFSTKVSVSGVSDGLCGLRRTGHFDGVATVVCKLFNQIAPDYALFGEKDWQQIAVIRRLVRDLNFSYPSPEGIIAVPTVREPDGLAMSSRNAYLSKEDRRKANSLYSLLHDAANAMEGGGEVVEVIEQTKNRLIANGFTSVDYIDLRDSDSLKLHSKICCSSMRLFASATINGTRLIDNVPIKSIR
ncbi:MAG: pantoate--beta-alanine ligase [Halothiobacillus sp.]|nr:pantoate--beta-alanine ligase [Halothiobacillus sp.]